MVVGGLQKWKSILFIPLLQHTLIVQELSILHLFLFRTNHAPKVITVSIHTNNCYISPKVIICPQNSFDQNLPVFHVNHEHFQIILLFWNFFNKSNRRQTLSGSAAEEPRARVSSSLCHASTNTGVTGLIRIISRLGGLCRMFTKTSQLWAICEWSETGKKELENLFLF